MSTAAFRRCLLDLDVAGVRELWSRIAPGMPQPQTDADALISLHHARTQADTMPERVRCYSHSWLTERGLPSALPDRLKVKADRLYPRTVTAVGVAVKSLSSGGTEYAAAVEKAMSDAVAECYAHGETDPELIKARMNAARLRV